MKALKYLLKYYDPDSQEYCTVLSDKRLWRMHLEEKNVCGIDAHDGSDKIRGDDGFASQVVSDAKASSNVGIQPDGSGDVYTSDISSHKVVESA